MQLVLGKNIQPKQGTVSPNSWNERMSRRSGRSNFLLRVQDIWQSALLKNKYNKQQPSYKHTKLDPILLDGWHQCVQVDNTLSSFTASTMGVPQGSMLGPLLFSLYIDHLPSVDWWLMMTDLIMYADDALCCMLMEKCEKLLLQNFCLTLYVKKLFFL